MGSEGGRQRPLFLFTAAEHGPGFVVFRALRSLDSRLPHGGAPTAWKHSKQVAALTVGM